jgi:hypothetical protein
MRPLAAGVALALMGLGSCSRSAGFHPGDCVAYADDEGAVLETDRSAVKNTPMRVLAETAPGMYLVEWETLWLDRSLVPDQTERNQAVLPARAGYFHFVKALCPERRR